jgi:toxin-antitoxin system PIN domain toxin
MFLIDVNVLVYAHRADALNHSRYGQWLASVIDADAAYGMSDLILSGFVRIVTHPRVFREPSPLDAAFAFATEVRDRANCVLVRPGERHWEIFEQLCREAGAKGNLISDAYFAALAIESGSVWVTTDRDYARFRGLEWRHPLD